MWQKLRNSLAFIFYKTPWMSNEFLKRRFNPSSEYKFLFKFLNEEISLPFIRQSKNVPVFFRSLIEPRLTSSADANTNAKSSRANVDLRSHKYRLNMSHARSTLNANVCPASTSIVSIKASSSLFPFRLFFFSFHEITGKTTCKRDRFIIEADYCEIQIDLTFCAGNRFADHNERPNRIQ